jgi:hypothetical protein
MEIGSAQVKLGDSLVTTKFPFLGDIKVSMINVQVHDRCQE